MSCTSSPQAAGPQGPSAQSGGESHFPSLLIDPLTYRPAPLDRRLHGPASQWQTPGGATNVLSTPGGAANVLWTSGGATCVLQTPESATPRAYCRHQGAPHAYCRHQGAPHAYCRHWVLHDAISDHLPACLHASDTRGFVRHSRLNAAQHPEKPCESVDPGQEKAAGSETTAPRCSHSPCA